MSCRLSQVYVNKRINISVDAVVHLFQAVPRAAQLLDGSTQIVREYSEQLLIQFVREK